jgi:UDP-N-acetylmuramoyl-tripeptide--D-alanyl-D-alanine ligase
MVPIEQTGNAMAVHHQTSPGKPISWTVADCLAATGGQLVGEDTGRAFSRVIIDSRIITAEDLFVAVVGETHDGHDFVAQVIRSGARGFIIQQRRLQEFARRPSGGVCITVEDTTRALGALGRYHRQRNRASVVAITGSNGKTTTRQMTAAVVSQGYSTLSSRKNYNNHIGLPLTLLGICPQHRWAVVELGMNAPGEIAYLSSVCQPDIGVITNIGPAHLEGVGSIEGVMKAKGELLGNIDPQGTAVLNADDERVLQLAAQTRRRVMLYGLSEKAAIRAVDIQPADQGHSFRLILPEAEIRIELKIPGRFMISNALAAAGVGQIIGLGAEQIRNGLENFQPASGRMNLLHTRAGLHIIDDTYNANPGSMVGALDTLAALRKDRPSYVVMGDMKELGNQAAALHRQVGSLAGRSGITGLLATGDFAEEVAAGAAASGLQSSDIITGSKERIVQALRDRLQPEDWILVKGSRAMAMEEIIDRLREWADTKPEER